MTQQVASTTALVLGFLVVLLLGGRLIRYFGIAAEGRLNVGLLFSIVGYNLPYFFELLLPLSFFISLMLVFGRLYVDNEMAVINSSGISRGRLGRIMTPMIVALFIVEAGFSLYAKPWGVRQTEAAWQTQALSSAFDLIKPQNFITSGNYHLYVGSMSDDRQQLNDVIIIQTGNQHSENYDQSTGNQSESSDSNRQLSGSLTKDNLPTAQDTLILAKQAIQVNSPDNSSTIQLDLHQGRRYTIGADGLVYSQVGFERYRISLNKSPAAMTSNNSIATQSISNLWQMSHGKLVADNIVQNNEQLTPTMQKYTAQAELGYRLSLPWLIIIAPMLAVPLAQVRPRQGRWLRLLPAIMIFVSAALVITSLKNAITNGTVSVWTYPLIIVAFMILALYLNWASRLHHRVRFKLGKTSNKATNESDTKESRGRP